MSSRLLCVLTCDAQAENNTTNRLFKAKEAKNGFPEFLTCINASQVFVSEGPFRMGSSGDLGGYSNRGGSIGRIGIKSGMQNPVISKCKPRKLVKVHDLSLHCFGMKCSANIKGQLLHLYFKIIMKSRNNYRARGNEG